MKLAYAWSNYFAFVGGAVNLMRRALSSAAPVAYNFETLNVTRPKEFVVHVEVNRPEKRNAQNSTFYRFVTVT